MMTGTNWIVIENDGVLDLRLVELLGASTKDGQDKIGIFGSGWKYGLALALRKGIQVQIISGNQHVVFSTMPETVNDGTIFDRIAYSVNGKRRKKTSLTTRLGQQDWDDEWFFLREVVANALDESGIAIHRSEHIDIDCPENRTRVVMSPTPRLEEVLNNLNMFIRDCGEIDLTAYGRILESVSDKCRIYKQGIFVKELDKKGLYDYDLKNLELTESRTADSWNIRWELRKVLTAASIDVRRHVLRTIEKSNEESKSVIESDLDYDGYIPDFDTKKQWAEAFQAEYGDEGVLCPDTETITTSISNLNKRPLSFPEKVAQVLRDGAILTERDLLGAAAADGFIFKEPTQYEQTITNKLSEILSFFFGENMGNIPKKIFCAEGRHEMTDAHISVENERDRTLLLNENVIEQGLRKTLECAHFEYIKFLGQYENEAYLTEVGSNLIEHVLPRVGVIL